jgi:hypothetical protein
VIKILSRSKYSHSFNNIKETNKKRTKKEKKTVFLYQKSRRVFGMLS